MSTDKIEAKYSRRSKRWKLIIIGLVGALIAVLIICLNISIAPISFSEILNILGKQIPFLNNLINPSAISSTNEAIILQIRLPRVLGGAIIGAGLAAAGVMYQGIFRNPMADSYLLGASAGASFAYTLAVLFGGMVALNVVGLGFSQIAAFAGALLTVFLVYLISRVGNKVPVTTLLLSGIVANIFILSLQTVLVFRAGERLQGIIAFTFGGSLTTLTWNNLLVVFPIVLAGTIIAYFFTRDLNMLSMGDETAQHLGVNTERVRQVLLIASSLITGAVVSISGVIGFVGLIIPHMTRLIIGPDHRILLPATAIVGAIFLVFCDSIARVATGVAELPVGAITALFGTPVFIYLLRRRKTTYAM
jgi:iron complex transport system permease protein